MVDKKFLFMVSGSKSILSKAIMYFTSGDVSHCALTISNAIADRNILLTQADEHGVNNKGKLSEYIKPKKWFRLYAVPWDEAKIKDLIREIKKHDDADPYGYLHLLGLAIPTFLSKLGIKIKRWVGLGVVCSTYCWFLITIGCKQDSELYKKVKSYSKNLFNPENLDDCLQESKDVVFVAEKKVGENFITWYK